ncbi:alpha-L-fucosidase [Draconibacterium sp. IB214405]|uniref:alpha-L-fucosidase n=1 Tax=Draconibacterium sp. IB214405 TaxID=3097352 RepID=UPI002A0D99CB|nr:alpha-L-fucosidase [Draconibacterium sp. IB214405]MDX8340688.1 alpha-L-fucosidase [Draconibacterium sp. IB214405]
MKNIATYIVLTLSFVVLFLSNAVSQKLPRESSEIPVPTQAQVNWQNAEMVAVFHYDLHVFDGKKYVQRENRITPVPDYNIFNPKKLDTDQWIKAAKDAGCKIAILTATHETGFALYQSDVNPYSLKAVKWRDGKGDIVKDFVESCRKYDVLPGIYIGIRWNSFLGVYDFKVSGEGAFAENRQKYYNSICEGMTEELMSRYGDLAIVWFDGGAHGPEKGGPDVLGIFEKHQKNCIFYHNTQRADIRWGGSESGTVPYPSWGTYPYHYSHSTNQEIIFKNNFQLLKEGDPNGAYYMPAMSDAPLRGYNGRHEWFWEPGDDDAVYPLDKLVNMYYNSVGHNSSLILGLTPDADGLLPESDVKRLKELGDEIKSRFANQLATTAGVGTKFTLKLNKGQKVNQVVMAENIESGERVRKFVLEGKTNKGWQTIFEGSCIGHKFIHLFDEMEVKELRLKISESRAEPQIAAFSAFYIEN